MQDSRKLPEAVDIERSVLSALFIDPEDITELSLVPEHFYLTSHQIIYKAMQKLMAKGISFDLLSIKEALDSTGSLQIVGGISHLAQLCDVPMCANLIHAETTIKDKFNLRQLLKSANKIMNDCYDGKKDPATILQQSQISVMDVGAHKGKMTHISDVMSRTMEHLGAVMDGKFPPALMSRIPKLDSMSSGFHLTDLVLLAARPAMGKSAFAFNLARQFAKEGAPVLIFSMEMEDRQIANRLLSERAEVNNSKFRSAKFDNAEWKRVGEKVEVLSELPIHIDDRAGLTLDDIASTARRYKARYGIKSIIIDYIQMINGWDTPGQTEKSAISNGLKVLAKELNVNILALSQLNRSLENRAEKMPIMSDLRDSGTLEQAADAIYFLYRDHVYNSSADPTAAILKIAKSRHGALASIDLKFEGKYTRFTGRPY